MNIIQDIFSYPIRGSGKYMLITGAIIGIISDLASFAPVLGFVAGILLSGYFCAIYFDIIQTTATGSSEAPYFPDTMDILGDILAPMGKVIAVLFVSFLPLLAFIFTADDEYQTTENYLLLAGIGAVYFPMAMLAVVVLGYLGALSPHIVLPAMMRSGMLYWLAVFLLILLYMFLFFVAGFLADSFMLSSLVFAVLGMYVIMANGRILGIIYREREEELGWV